MSHFTAALVGGAAGFSIFLGLPIARLKAISKGVQGFLNAIATGVLVFLIWDILSHASAPVETSLTPLRHGNWTEFVVLVLIFAGGITVGMLSLVYFNGLMVGRAKAAGQSEDARMLAMAIATGLGLHNLSEGLAIGQSVATGAIAFAGVLVIGFALHNITEGFGIAAPMAGGSRPSWGFLGLAGLIGGGPTFLGTIIGLFFTSPYLYVAFLALAAGALFWVINEMFSVSRKLNSPRALGWGLLTGFLVAYSTDLLLTFLSA